MSDTTADTPDPTLSITLHYPDGTTIEWTGSASEQPKVTAMLIKADAVKRLAYAQQVANDAQAQLLQAQADAKAAGA